MNVQNEALTGTGRNNNIGEAQRSASAKRKGNCRIGEEHIDVGIFVFFAWIGVIKGSLEVNDHDWS
jgi:hypothetical protein